MVTLKSTLVTASDEVRRELEPFSDIRLITACARFIEPGALTGPEAAMRHVLGALARRWLELHEEIKIHTRHLKQVTKKAATARPMQHCIGPWWCGCAGINQRARTLSAVALGDYR